MDRLRVVIAGCGRMGRWHAYHAARAGAQVAAGIDPDAGAAGALCRRLLEARAFPDLADYLRANAADVVHICTPAADHVALARQALRAGCHVVVEKPVVASAAEGRVYIDELRKPARRKQESGR